MHELVYVPSQKLWVSPSSCVWAARPKIGNQYGISEMYGHMSGFFQEVLQVHAPSTETYIEQLKAQVPSGYAAINDIEETMHNVNGMHFSDAQVEELHHLAFLPVRNADGTRRLAKPSEAFLIANRIEYDAAFRDQITTLDFSIEQIIRFQPLVAALGLEGRFMSRRIRMVTEARNPDSDVDSRATTRFRHRAKHLYRFVAVFKKPLA